MIYIGKVKGTLIVFSPIQTEDLLVGEEVYVLGDDGHMHHKIIEEVLDPVTYWKAYSADDGCRYGIYNTYVILEHAVIPEHACDPFSHVIVDGEPDVLDELDAILEEEGVGISRKEEYYKDIIFKDQPPAYKASLIQEEKNLAKNLLKSCKNICSGAFIAGGAPLDWLMGSFCNDIDIFLTMGESNDSETMKETHRIVTNLLLAPYGVTVTRSRITSSPYKKMEGLVNVFTTTIRDQRVQFIYLSKDALSKHVDGFSCSICKVWLDLDNRDNFVPMYHEDFMLSMVSGVMFLTEGYKWSDFHPKKVADKVQLKQYPFKKGIRQVALESVLFEAFSKAMEGYSETF